MSTTITDFQASIQQGYMAWTAEVQVESYWPRDCTGLWMVRCPPPTNAKSLRGHLSSGCGLPRSPQPLPSDKAETAICETDLKHKRIEQRRHEETACRIFSKATLDDLQAKGFPGPIRATAIKKTRTNSDAKNHGWHYNSEKRNQRQHNLCSLANLSAELEEDCGCFQSVRWNHWMFPSP